MDQQQDTDMVAEVEENQAAFMRVERLEKGGVRQKGGSSYH
jgi:hypothetical protein